MQALGELTVLELGEGVAVAFAGKTFADFGADVIKVEAPRGDPARCWGPYAGGRPDPEGSAPFLFFNRNKRGVTLDPASRACRDLLARLAAAADLILAAISLRDLAELGISLSALAPGRPAVVIASLTAFGEDGPYRDFRATELTADAMGGRVSMTGQPSRAPLSKPMHLVAAQVGNTLAAAALAAVVASRRAGEAQDVEVSATEVLLTVVWSGPSACRMLAALGAEVIRVESIDHFPASSRGPVPYPPPELIARASGLAAAYPDKDPGPDPYNRYAPFLITGQGKRSATMELYTEEGRRAFRQLVQCSDVLVENNSRTISNALRLTWEELGPVNPGLVLVRMAPLGLDGPYADATGYGMHFEALTGIGSLRGHADADPGDAGSTFHMDDVAPQGVVFAVLAALMQRERTGRGQLIEFAQGEYLMQGLGDAFVASSLDGQAFSPQGNRHPAWIQGCYPCRGDDQWIALTVRDDAELAGLTGVLGDPEWAADPRFASVAAGREYQDELDQRLAAATAGWSKRALFLALQQAAVPAAPVYDEADAYADPHFEHRQVFRPVTHPSAGTHLYPSFGARWSGLEPEWGRPAPLIGQDNEYVYKTLLHYTDEEYDRLAADGLIGTTYPRGA